MDGCAGMDSPLLEINRIEAFGRGVIKDEKPLRLRIETFMRSGSFFVLGTSPDPLSMYLSHCGTLFGTRIQPVEDQSFYDPLRIR